MFPDAENPAGPPETPADRSHPVFWDDDDWDVFLPDDDLEPQPDRGDFLLPEHSDPFSLLPLSAA